MNYLISQITISLLLAAIVGAAIGWLIHRSKASKQIRSLQDVVGRQQQHVNEAQTEVSIIAGDFDDLKQQSESEISALKTENQKIPALHQNLEKSQLLVRQLMQQHKAELDELSIENEKLSGKAKLADERERSISKLQAELDIAKRNNKGAEKNNSNNDSKNATNKETSRASNSESTTAANEKKEKTPATSNEDSQQPVNSSQGNNDKAEQDVPVQAESTIEEASTKRLPLSANAGTRTESTTSGIVVGTANAGISASTSDSTSEKVQTELELEALRDQLADSDSPSSANGASGAIAETAPESGSHSEELTPIFDPVDQHDDLKQIFGIGPVTEKTLNKLGITAYSQLAELKQHDIKKIADALQIFPGRIERDNWVGSARSQLEEVLEEL